LSANPARGEAAITCAGASLTLRPSFAALVAAEEEIGPLFALVERAAAGAITLRELTGLLWHCLANRPDRITREQFGDAIVEIGLAAAMVPLRTLIGQILKGR
jgi:hypothetical protein